MKLLNAMFVAVFCLATVVLASLMALEIQYDPKWEMVYTLIGLMSTLLVGLLNVVAWFRKKKEAGKIQLPGEAAVSLNKNSRTILSMVKVFSSLYLHEAEFVQLLLRNYGIHSRLENAEIAHSVMGAPSILAPLAVVVDESDAEQALAVIRREVKTS